MGMRGSKRKILLVEDNEMNREIASAVLQGEFDIIEARDGVEGLELLEEHREDISVVLLDVYMPRCDGFEFLERKRADGRFDMIPVIVATASGVPADEIRCIELGANDFVVKPYNPEVMKNRIRNMIQLRESAALANLLMWDHLTDLYSKDYFHRVVEDAFAADPQAGYDMVCSDVESFKTLNDRYGEKRCDGILRELAESLSGAIPSLVASGRIGGDSFAFLVEHGRADWESVLLGAVNSLQVAHLNVKFGVVEQVDTAMTSAQVCNLAISALETVKGRHDDCVGYFDDELHRKQLLEQSLRDSMETALAEGQFRLFFQPKHDVRSGKTGGAEALVRWFHPELGRINPSVFITVFEQSGFITKLDLFVWEEACKQIRRCIDNGLPVIPISVNVSGIDFDLPDLPERVAAIAGKYGVDRSLLHVELTETAYAENPEAVAKSLAVFRELGFLVELDDFGAGYSSIVSLNTLPLDVMKLDLSMIRSATELNDYRILDSTIQLAKSLGLKTVVEGVESADEAARVADLGCDCIQGYYYARPLSQQDFESYLLRESE